MDMKRISVKLAYFLRHCENPRYIDLNGGWASVSEILKALKSVSSDVNLSVLEQIVAEDKKGRYSFYDETHQKIRANQGHSIPGVTIEMEQPKPPEFLYHGTATRFLDSIFKEGLKPHASSEKSKPRQFVHISSDYETAVQVGSRHGKPVVLKIRAKDFVNDGHELYISSNGVWQAKYVPVEYFSVYYPE